MWRLVQTAKTVLGSCLSTGWRLITEKNLLPLKLGREATTWLNGSQRALYHGRLHGPLTEEGLLRAMPQLLSPVAITQALSVSEVRKYPS
jgi:hypothetical protein